MQKRSLPFPIEPCADVQGNSAESMCSNESDATHHPMICTETDGNALNLLIERWREDDCYNERQRQILRDHIEQVLPWHARVAVMGKCGTGKSTLCNALSGLESAPTDAVQPCTAQCQDIVLVQSGASGISLIDAPGFGVSESWDAGCLAIYQQLVGQVDLILWLIKGDDRALGIDRQTFVQVKHWVDVIAPIPILLVINHADKVEPATEWDWRNCRAGPEQRKNIQRAIDRISQLFEWPVCSICVISALQNHGLTDLMELVMRGLSLHESRTV